MDAQTALALFGTTQAVTPAQQLTAGALSCEFVDGQLRHVCWGDVEVLRGVSYLLRDRDWGTVPATVSGLDIQASGESFDLRFDLRMATPQGTLLAAARLRGNQDGALSFEVRATADAALDANRCGFVVLHPASAAGLPLLVEHTDGSRSDTQFPLTISPSQPALDIRALAYAPADGVHLQLRLEAELPHDARGKFEMEDQRNWSDASFKTYAASLLDPWPFTLPAHRELVQRVSLLVRGRSPAEAAPARQPDALAWGVAGDLRMPDIGVGIPPGLSQARADETAALRALGAQWWVVEADLRDAALPADLSAVARCRGALPVRVQLDVIVSEQASPRGAATQAAGLCRRVGLVADAVRLLAAPYLKSFQPSDRWPDLPPLEAYAAAARQCFPQALIGGGMFTSFTETNRKRQSAEGLDFIAHLTCPIVHAADDDAVLQTIETLPHIARSVRSLWPGLAYRLGPSAIAPRRNPYGEGLAPNAQNERLALASHDPRHGALFGAVWTVAYAAAAAPLGLDLLAMHDSHGPGGPLARENDLFDGPALVPAWRALQELARAAGARQVPLLNLPPGLAGLAWTHDGVLVEGIIANLHTHRVTVRSTVDLCLDAGGPTRQCGLDGFQVAVFRSALGPAPTAGTTRSGA